MPPLLVLYGTETGNAQAIAERIHALALTSHAKPRPEQPVLSPIALGRLDDYESLGLLDASNGRVALVVVCSTTGNGDAPKSATKFFSFIKRRTAPTNLLAHVSYVVLALGDTNYSKFCFAGKLIDTRLAAVGAARLAPCTCADEVAGLDATVEPFIERALSLVLKTHFSTHEAGGDSPALMGKSATASGVEVPPLAPLPESAAAAVAPTTTNSTTTPTTEQQRQEEPTEPLGWFPSPSPLKPLAEILTPAEAGEKPTHPARARAPVKLTREAANAPLVKHRTNARVVGRKYLVHHPPDRVVVELLVEVESDPSSGEAPPPKASALSLIHI